MLRNHVRREVAAGSARLAGAVPEDTRLSFSIVLPLRNEVELDQLLTRLYDPSSPDYRQFLSVAEFTEKFGPTAQDYAAVAAFARANGLDVTGAPANRLVVPISGTAGAINSAFHVRMSLYQHPTENRVFFSPDREPSLALTVPVAHLAGLNNFSIPKPTVKRATEGHAVGDITGSGPGGSYLASDMRAAYYGGNQLTGSGQAVGLLEFGGYYLSDLNATFSNAGQSYSVPVNNVLLDGAIAEPVQGQDDAEQVLDIIQAIGMAPGLSQVRVYIGNANGSAPDDANVLNAMASENIAKALSCSWDWLPEDPGTDDVFFKEFAAQGQSFFVASGDSGAFDAAIDPFFYPGEDPYVTTVGGTHLTTVSAGGAWYAETAWNSPPYGSGGGVSPDGIAIPSWQAGLETSANGASTTLRNLPDVAMEGDFDNYTCALTVCSGDYAGTSFAAPRWAGFIALVNQQAVEAGTAPKGGVGFLNPSIYSISTGSKYLSDFHDIVSGNNRTNSQPVWYSAVTGYDLVTGWGSPTGQNLINDLAGKQAPGFWLSASSASVVMNPGASGSTTMNVVDAGGFTGTVQLAITSVLPSGVTAKWGTNPTSGSSVLTLTATSATANTTTAVTITGKSGSITEKTQITLTVHTPSFSLSTIPGSVDILPGNSAPETVVVTPLYGFTGSVKLAVSGLPSGVTATVGTNPTTGTSVLTFNASSSAAAGTSNVTITGTSGSVTATTTLPLTVHLPTFKLSNGGDVNIGPGTSGTTYILVQDEYGFSGNVHLSAAGLPSGVTASFSPNPTANYGVLTLTTSSTTALGSSTLTITGTSGSLTATTSLKLNVLAPAFTLSGPVQLSIGQGTTTTSWVSVNPEYGFSGSVNLSVSGLPNGVTASISPNPASGAAALTLNASSAAAVGMSTVTITGTSGSLKATTTLSLGVYVPTFTLFNGGPVNVGRGSSASTFIFVNPEYGFTGSVNFAVAGLPSGVTASISPNPVTGTAVLTLNASSAAALGSSTLTITGVSGTQSVKTTLQLGVFEPTFTLSGPGPVTLGVGSSVSPSVYVSPQNGFAGSVNLSISGLPSGVTASFSPNPTTGNSLLTLMASSAAKAGNYTVTVAGISGTKTANTTFPLTVAMPGFTLSSNGPVTLGLSTSSTTFVSVNPLNGFTDSVHLAVSGLPSGVTASLSPNLVTGYSSLTLTASATAAVGSSTITITGTSGTQTATTTIALTVAAPTFTLWSSGGLIISPGGTNTAYVWVNPQNGFTGSVNLSVTGLPAGVTASFSPNSTSGSSTLTLTASSTAAMGNWTATIKGAYGSQTATTPLPVTISAPTFTLSGPGNVQLAPGGAATASFNVWGGQGLPGSVNLSVAGLPSGVTASFSPNPTSGSSLLTLKALSSAAPGTTTLTITGTQGKTTATTTLQVQVHAPEFAISGPSNLSISQGGTITSYVNINSEFGFAGLVNLSVTGLPTGVTASWTSNPTIYNSTLTLTASSTAALVGKTVTITGVSGSLTASTTFQLAVQPPAFTVSSYSDVNLGQGTSATASLYLNSQSGFSGNVSLSISGLPSGVTASFSPVSTNWSSVLTLTAASTATLGQYNAVITGTYGKQTSSSLLNVTVSTPSFTVGTFGSLQVGRGSSTTSSVNVSSQNGFTGSVQLSAVGLPNGVSASFSPNPTNGNSTITLTATNTASLGEYNATIVGTYGKQIVSTPISVAVYSPTFTLSSYGGPALSPGSSGQTYVSVNPQYGFTGSVRLSVSGLPSGVTAAFSPNPATDQSALTLTASSAVSPGQYNLTVTGVSGTQNATVLVPLTISVPTFTLWSPGVNLGQGTSVTTSVIVNTQNGFNSPVQLQATGLPGGVTASFSPNPTTSSSTLTLTASSSANPGQYNATITGKGGGQTAATLIPVTVAPPSFTLSGPGAVSLGQGTSTTTYANVEPQFGFTGNVKFSIAGLPAGVIASFSPNPAASSTTLSLTASSSAAAGQYSATIVGTSGTQTASCPFVLTVAAPGFTLWSGGSVNLGQGTSTTTSVSVTPAFGFSGTVRFAASGLPNGVTASFSPSSSTSGTTLTLTATSTASAGEYVATISGTSGATTATTLIYVTVATPSFTLWSYGNVQLGQGSSTTTYISMNTAFGFTGGVQLAASGLPSGVTASFSPNPITGSSILTLLASSSVPPGQYNIKVTGTSGSQSASTTILLNVLTPTFTITTTNWGSLNIGRGTSTTTQVYVNAEYGFTGDVKLAVSGLPSGVTASLSPNPTTNNSILTLTASSTASLGQYNATITGTSGTQTVTSTLTLGVYAPAFTLFPPGNQIIGQGTSITTNVYVTPEYGFVGSVQFAVSGLPSGVTASFSPNPTTNTGILKLTASSTASLGEYTVTLTGTCGSQSASTTFALSVYVPTFTVWTTPYATLGQGTSNSMSVSVGPEYGFTGNVHLAVSGLPSGVTASFSPNPATNSSILKLTASSNTPLGQYTITLTGTSGSQSTSTTFALGVFVPTFMVWTTPYEILGQGTSNSMSVNVNPEYGFTGNVQFAVSGLPSGVTASFSPNPATNSSILKLTASSNTPLGSHTVTLTGTSGSQSISTTFLLSVFVPTFTLNNYFGSPTLSPGGSSQTYITIDEEYGFNGNIQLTVSGLPSGVTASFSPNPGTSYSDLSLKAGNSVTAGQYTLTVAGTSGSQKATTSVGLTIN